MSKPIKTDSIIEKETIEYSRLKDHEISKFIGNDAIFENAKTHFRKNKDIKNDCKKNQSARSVKYWTERGYNDNDATILANSRNPNSYEYFRIFKKMSIDEAIKATINKRKKIRITLENLIEKHGEVKGKEKWDSYCEKHRVKNTFEFKRDNLGWTREQFDKFNKDRSVTKENLISRWGKTVGLEKWKKYCERQAFTNKLEYFSEKLGTEKGTEKYNKINFLKTHSYESYLYRYKDENIAKEKFLSYITSLQNRESNKVSEISIELFDSIKIELFKEDLTFIYGIPEQMFYDETKKNFYFVDFYVPESGKIIEFFGDYWHCSRDLFEDENIELPRNFISRYRTPKEIRQHDEERCNFLKSVVGEENLLIVWESSFRKNKEDVLKKCVDFILKKRDYDVRIII